MKEYSISTIFSDFLLPLLLTIGGILAVLGVASLLSQCTAVYTQNPDGSVQFSGSVAEPSTVTPQKK